ncbi:hypothetical protein [Kribbella deserti]|uniref:Tail fiber protein n=1 Tax=Kribbella deserti TaxID=1926257 RepID=A0ABV6QJA8_9ACTN
MAGLGFKDFANGNVLTGDELDGYLMQQSVMRFANAAARDNALTAVKADGMLAYTTADTVLAQYDGNGWVPLESQWQTWTPSWTGGTTSPSFGSAPRTGHWRYAGGMVVGYFKVTMNASTTYGNGAWLLSLPVNAHADWAFTAPVGQVSCFDASASALMQRDAWTVGSPSSFGIGDQSGTRIAAALPFTWTTNDILTVSVRYRPA